MTKAGLEAEITGFLQINTGDTDKYQTLSALNRAQLHLLNILPTRLVANAIRTWRWKLVQDIAQYQWPADYIRFVSLELNYSDPITETNPGRPAREVKESAALFDDSNVDLLPTTDYPAVATDLEGGYHIRPIPTADVIDGQRCRYVYQLPDISNTQPCLLWPNLRNLLLFYATSLSATIEGNSLGLQKEFFGYYQEELERLVPGSSKRKDQ